MASRVLGRTRCTRASSGGSWPLAAAAAARVRVSRPSWRATARRVPADRASGCSSGTARITSAAPRISTAAEAARSSPTWAASEARSSATSRSCCRGVAASSEKLKSTIVGWPAGVTITLAARSDRCAMPARCSVPTSVHSRASRSSPIWPAGSRSSERPSTHSRTSRAVSPARTIRSTGGVDTPARSAIIPTRAWRSTAWKSEAAGRVSPTFRSRTARYARYSRSASRWSDPRALTNSRRPSAVTAANGREPLVSTSAGRTESTGRPASRNAAAISPGPIRWSGTPNTTRTAAPTVTPAARARISCIGSIVPARIRTPPASSSVSQATRRQGRLSQGAAPTATAAADANSAGAGNAAPATQESCPRWAVSAAGRCAPIRRKIPSARTAATTAPAASPASSRNRRLRSVAATTTTTGARQATCTRPVMTWPTVPRPPGADAAGPRSHRNAAAEAANAPASRRPAEISRITSPG
jgi:hypothetical protein